MIYLLSVVVLALGYYAYWIHGKLVSVRVRIFQVENDLDCNGRVLDQYTKWLEAPQGMVCLKKGKLAKSTADAACYDVFSRVDLIINPGEMAIVPTGVVTEMYQADALLLDRSGLASKFRVTRRAGVIDAKYPDEWGVVLVNEGRLPYQVKAGDRIAQALFIPKFNIPVDVTGSDACVEKSDGTRIGGFGSTGK